MRIEILPEAEQDLLEGIRFYESQCAGVGGHFLECLLTDIQSLQQFAGVHGRDLGYHRMLAKRFPFAVYYRIENSAIRIYAVLDCRRNPAWIRKRLSPE
jgi:plasmid stabilization system protein ParE